MILTPWLLFFAATTLMSSSLMGRESFDPLVITYPIHLHRVPGEKNLQLIRLYNETWSCMSFVRQVNEFCFEYRVYHDSCTSIVGHLSDDIQLLFDGMLYDQVHTTFRFNGQFLSEHYIARSSYEQHVTDRYMEFITPQTGDLFNYIFMNAPIQVEMRMLYIIGTDTRTIAHLIHFIHHLWSDAQLLIFNPITDFHYIQTEALYRFYIGNLGSVDQKIAYSWYNAEYHRSSNALFEEKILRNINSDITSSSERDRDEYSYFSYTLDTIIKSLSLTFPQVIIIQGDINTLQILSGASETISRSDVLYLIISMNIGRKDYYHLTANKLIPLVLDIFHEFKLLHVYNENSEEHCDYLLGKA